MLKLRLSFSLCVFIFALSCHVIVDAQDGSVSLLYCDGDIRNFSLTSSHMDSLLMSGISAPITVDYHLKNKVLFILAHNDGICKAPLWQEGARPSVFRGTVHSYGLAVDWIHNLVYWTEYLHDKISLARLDGSMERTVLKEEGIDPWSIVLNPAEGFMFWSDSGDIKKIERCTMDGTNRKVIIKEDIDTSYLAIDLGSRRIFWVDINKNYVSSATFDGNHRKNLLTQLSSPISIDIYGQHVYFVTNQGKRNAVYKASKVDGSDLTKVIDGEVNLNCVKVFDPSKQSHGNNVCGDNNGGCSHLCLPTSNHTFSCACPNDSIMSSDNFTCLNSDEENKNVDATFGYTGTPETLSLAVSLLVLLVVSLTPIAMIGMVIYNRQFIMKAVGNSGITNSVQKKNCEENMSVEAPV